MSAMRTPGPWEIDVENCGDGANIRAPSGRVAWTSALRRVRTGEREIEAEEAKANAAFIVEAVNAHDMLVAAIQKAADIMRNNLGRQDEKLADVEPLLRSALANVTGAR